jgi:hypothetical protein
MEPKKIVAGNSYKWTRSFTDYLPSAGWTVRYQLIGLGQNYTFDATVNGETFEVVVPASVTAEIAAGGSYRLVGLRIHAANDERGTFYSFPTPVIADPAKIGDVRSYAERVLAAIEAMIEKSASKDQQAIIVDGQSLQRRTATDLLMLRDRFRREVQDERRKEELAAGIGSTGRVQLRSTR